MHCGCWRAEWYWSLACLGRIATRSKSSLALPLLSRFSTTWGICFSLKGNPSRLNTRGFVTVLPRSTHEIGRPWPSSETTRGNGRGRDVSAAAIKATCARVAP